MVAFVCPDIATVEKAHRVALDAGASDDGAPGERIPGFYGAYFRDPTGNKICVFHMS